MLEVGRVVDPRREDDDRRVARVRRGHILEHRQELFGVVLHRADAQTLEELREGALHDLPVFEDVRHPRGGAEVVLEDVHAAVATPNEVGAGDVAPHAPRRRQTGTRPAKALPRVDEPVGYDAILDDPAPVVDIVDEQVEGVDPLLQAALDRRPLGGVDDPRHDVERPDLLRPRLVAVDVERDPHREERLVGGPLPGGKLAVREGGETTDELLSARSGLERFVEEFVPESVGDVRPQVHGGGGVGTTPLPHRKARGKAAGRQGGERREGVRGGHSGASRLHHTGTSSLYPTGPREGTLPRQQFSRQARAGPQPATTRRR